MELKLYNTLTRKKEPFRPLDPAQVRMYVCGPTVYDLAHIGNARPLIVFDVLFRLLRHLAKQGLWDSGKGQTEVVYVRNITDVDDKINARAAERGISIRDVTEETYRAFQEDVTALGCLPPTHEPRATEYVRRDDGKIDMITLITRLIANGNAYAADGHVLFNVPSMPDYGALSQRPLDEMIAGARVEVAPYKRDPQDFVLWKPSSASEPGWDSPWGFGRPGWHIECSAMSAALLGETFDIHGGGIDLVFPHHENEIAQSRCAFATPVMAKVWMHNGYLQVEGEKMSKSLGNFVTIRELLTSWEGYGWPADAIRFNMLKTHYRQPIDWTLAGLNEAHQTLWDWYGELAGVSVAEEVPTTILDALSEDMNTPQVFAELHKLERRKEYSSLFATLRLLGLSGKRDLIKRSHNLKAEDLVIGPPEIGQPKLTETKLRGSKAIEQEQVEHLVAARVAARNEKNFAESDRIRDELVAMGIVLKDSKDPATGELTTEWEFKR